MQGNEPPNSSDYQVSYLALGTLPLAAAGHHLRLQKGPETVLHTTNQA